MRLRLVPFKQFAQLGDLLLAQVVPLAAFDPVDEIPDERRQLDGIERLRHVVDTAEVDSLRAIPDLGAGCQEDDRNAVRRCLYDGGVLDVSRARGADRAQLLDLQSA